MQIKRLDHISFTVEDIDRSAAFYERFGFERHKDYVSKGPDVDAGTDTPSADLQIRWLRRGDDGPMLELIRYVEQPGGPSAHNSRVGAAHLCFGVEDVRGAVEELTSAGVTFVSAPHEDEFGTVWVYMRDPDGNVCEMIQDPASA